MAQFYPELLPESVRQNPLRGAERRVYTALAALPAPFTVFYSVAWLNRSAQDAQDGEADFVVAHPELGLLVLEVKRGGVAYDAGSSQWTSTDHNGAIHPIKSPAQQARANKHTLFNSLRGLPEWENRWRTLGHGVVLPDVETRHPSPSLHPLHSPCWRPGQTFRKHPRAILRPSPHRRTS